MSSRAAPSRASVKKAHPAAAAPAKDPRRRAAPPRLRRGASFAELLRGHPRGEAKASVAGEGSAELDREPARDAGLPRGRLVGRPGSERADRERTEHERWRGPEEPAPAFEPFRATPVLQTLAPSEPAAVGSGLERAQAAAMAERLLHSVRVGKVAGGHEVRLTLAGSGVEVRLRQVDGRLRTELHLPEGASARAAASADSLAARLDAELRAAGLDVEGVDVVG